METRLQGGVETKLSARCVKSSQSTGCIIAWKTGCLPATGSCGNLALCQLWGFVKTKLSISHWVTWKPSCPLAMPAIVANSSVPATELREDPALYWLRGLVEIQLYASHRGTWKPGSVPVQGCIETKLCTGYGVAWKPSCMPATPKG